MKTRLPISEKYRKPVFEALAVQIVLGIFFALLLDGGYLAKIFGIGVAAFWVGVALLISRNRQTPAQIDISLIRIGIFPLFLIALIMSKFV